MQTYIHTYIHTYAGHEDFSEDTYRTIAAADNVVIHTYIYTHTYTHTQVTRTSARTRTGPSLQLIMLSCTHAYMHIYIHTYTHIHAYAGHEDFSEDTYRTIAAADNAVMLLDGAKGLEAQTLKLFAVVKVCMCVYMSGHVV